MHPKTIAACLAALLSAACAQAPLLRGEVPPESAPTVQPAPAAELLPEPPASPPPVPARSEASEPAPPAHLWERIRRGFRLRDLDGPLVREWEQWYATRPDYVARMVERSRRFLFHVVEEVERRGVPAEIALLPMIESAYNPNAHSRSHASGMWQFIPSTGRLYGLRQNFWYDGRRDPVAATTAALDYLEKLYAQFGDWELALAAYNWGEGAVGRAIARNQAKGLPTDYASLALPNETRNYVPKLQAVKNIISDPRRFGLSLAEVANEPYFAPVALQRHIDVTLAAKLAEMPLEEFRFLNPGHNKPVIRAHGSEVILLPLDRIDTFRRNLEAHDKPLVSWRTYTVRRGDRPDRIAARFGIPLARLKEVNGIAARRGFLPGQTILVPHAGAAEPELPDLPAPSVRPVRYAKACAKPQRARALKTAVCPAPKKRAATRSARVPAARVRVTLNP